MLTTGHARRLGVDDKVVRRVLDPRHATAANGIHKTLRLLGRELVVEIHRGVNGVGRVVSLWRCSASCTAPSGTAGADLVVRIIGEARAGVAV